MSIFDWVPTVPEIFEFAACRLVGHDWVDDGDGGKVCDTCGKRRE